MNHPGSLEDFYVSGVLDPRAEDFGSALPVGSFDLEAEVRRYRASLEARARRARESREGFTVLPATLSDALGQHASLYRPTTYGGRKVSVPANQTIDIPRTVDPNAYFVATAIAFRSTVQDLTLQLVEAGGVELFRAPIALPCLYQASGNFGIVPLPRDWILGPGDAFTIRARNRSVGAAVLDVHLLGFRVFVTERGIPAGGGARLADAEALEDYYVGDARGRVQRIPSTEGDEYPGARGMAPSPFPDLRLDAPGPFSVMRMLRGIQDPRRVGDLLAAFRSTYRPAAYGVGALAVAAGVDATSGNTGLVPLSGDSYFVGTHLAIGNATAAGTLAWELELLESASGFQLFGDRVDWRCFLVGNGGAAAPSGTLYPLPQPYVLRPRQEILFRVTNQDAGAGVSADIHLLGFRAFVR